MKIFDLDPERYLSECRKKVFALITLSIIILSIYSNTFHASWHFDDIPNIVESHDLHLTEFSWENIKKTFYSRPRVRGVYRPVACLSFALNYYLGRDNVFGYHMVNLSIHLLTTYFLFLFIYHTLNLPSLKGRKGMDPYFVALLSAVFWAINPIQTQAVTYIVQRMASMAGMFYIISMYFYVKGRRANQNWAGFIFFLLCGVSALLAFGSKQNAIMLPASLLLYDFFLIQGISRKTTKKNLGILLVGALVTISIGIVYYALSEAKLPEYFNLYHTRPFTLWERLITQPRIMIFYISLILYPMSTRLSLDHDIALSQSLFDPPTTILAIILVLAIVLGAILISKKRPLISFSVLFFFLNHMVESSILPLELIFEHRNYVPSMFLFVPIVIGLFHAISHFSDKRSMQVMVIVSIILVLIGEGHATFMRNFTWRSEETLWIDVIEKYPDSFRGNHNLAKYYFEHNQEEKGIEGYKKALGLEAIHSKDEKSTTALNLGIIYYNRGELEKAKSYYLQALTIDPCTKGANNNLAVLLSMTTRDQEEVFNLLKKAIACGRQSTQEHSNMGLLFIKAGRLDRGIAYLETALEMAPKNNDALEGLGYAYMKKGLLGKASIYFRRAFNQTPKNIRALLYLAQLYTIGGHKEKAQESLSQFVDFVQDRDLGAFLDELFGEESLLRIRPDMTIIYPLLSKIYEQKITSLKKNREFCLNH
jgi:tetratricopeptide (TPR) repeat protein